MALTGPYLGLMRCPYSVHRIAIEVVLTQFISGPVTEHDTPSILQRIRLSLILPFSREIQNILAHAADERPLAAF